MWTNASKIRAQITAPVLMKCSITHASTALATRESIALKVSNFQILLLRCYKEITCNPVVVSFSIAKSLEAAFLFYFPVEVLLIGYD